MPSQCFVIDEWLIHDLGGENGEKAQAEAITFLERLKEKCDKIAILLGSIWVKKAFRFMKHTKLFLREISKFFYEGILRDTKKCQFLNKNDLKPLPKDIREKIPEEKDVYLVETYYSAKANLLVTTDERSLYNFLSPLSINIKLRDAFLKEYLEEK